MLSVLKGEFGVFTTEKLTDKYQWAYPNLWAPCQYIAVKALENYGYIEEAKKIIDINENIKKELQDIAGCQKGLIVLGIPRERGFRQDKMFGRVFGCDRLGEDPGSALCSVKTGSREPEDLRRDLCEIRFFSQDPAGDKQQSDSFADGGRGSRGGDRAGDDDPSVPGKPEI